MVKFINLSFLLSSVFALSALTASASPINSQPEFKEDYYSIFVKNDGLDKRQESVSTDSLINEINNLILGHKDEYKNQKKLDALEETYKSNVLAKRSTTANETDADADAESGFAFPLFSYNDYTLIHTYLCPDLVELVSSLPNVYAVEPEVKVEYTTTYNKQYILKETGWKNLSVEKDAPFHLSLLSQGTFNDHFIGQYDENFYYPSSAGEDVDIFLFEPGFNFNHAEFSNKKDRTLKCLKSDATGVQVLDELDCKSGDLDYYTYHGEHVSDVAGGLKNGVAKKANLYGTVVENGSLPFIIESLIYIKENLLRSNKAVFNFSFVNYADLIENPHWPETTIHTLQDVINDITKQGGIFVASAGNNGVPAKYVYKNRRTVPCGLDNVICVGGVSTYNTSSLIENDVDGIYYKRHANSNYGEYVDLYAPFAANVEYTTIDQRNAKDVAEGTSFSAPIVAGLAATVISENKDVQFDHDKMLKYLRANGQKGIVGDIPHDKYNKDYDETDLENGENVFVNNGKHVVYSKNDKYEGCGPLFF